MKKSGFDFFGIMIDCSRNAVMSVEGLKKYLRLIKRIGYNCVLLYTEDTYEVNEEAYFGYMRGRYSKAEMKEIDSFASSIGMTVIPCIQTLAHLNTAMRWKKIPVDFRDILLVDDERSYEIIDHMFSTLSECFKSKRIHIGMDEAHMLGRGKHLDIHGYESVDVLMKRHLERVCKIAEKYGYELMMWSDMFFRPWNDGRYLIPKTEIPKEYVDALPKSVTPVYWDYYRTEEESYSAMMENHKQLSKNTWFAGGVWTWMGFAPFNKFSLDSMLPAIRAAKKQKIRNVFFTMWGDDGGECSRYSILPSLFYLAEYSKGNTDEDKIKSKFRKIFGISYDDFIKLDRANEITGNEQEKHPKCPSKCMLYADCFNAFLDSTVRIGGSEIYASYAKELRTISKKSRKLGYLFDTQAKLCELLSVKYELGVKTREAYRSANKAELKRLANEDYKTAIKLTDAFARAFEKQWFRENKTIGFDVQDMRLGGVIRRLDACRRRLLDYCNGSIDRIEELEGEILPFSEDVELGKSVKLNHYASSSTANVV